MVLQARVQPANVQDRTGAEQVLAPLQCQHRRLRKIWVDGSYNGPLAEWVWNLRQGRGRRRVVLEIVAKVKGHQFTVLPKRWIVERTFAWLGRSRRLSKDYEALPSVSQSLIWIAMIHLMTKRLGRLNDFSNTL